MYSSQLVLPRVLSVRICSLVILIFLTIFPPLVKGQKLCTKNAPSGGLVFRINETNSNAVTTGTSPNIVLDMSKKIGDLKSGVNLTLDDNPGDYFHLNPTNKQLILHKPIDRDATGLNVLNLKLTCGYIGADGQLASGKIVVKIFIDDINDNAPHFLNTPYIVNISSYAQVGAVVFINVKAVDSDLNENAQIHYRILSNVGTPKNASEYFIMNKLNQILLHKRLDMNYYNIVIEASDSPKNRSERQTSSSSVTFNVFDNRPPSFVHPSCVKLFSGICSNVDYRITIRADTMPGLQPLPVKPTPIEATDLDIEEYPVQYSFINGTPFSYTNFFFIDSHSGAVSQLKPVPNGLTKSFNITIMAKELGGLALASFANLIITVEDGGSNLYPPVLKASSLFGFIEENAEMGATVRTGEMVNSPPLQILVTDADLKPGMAPATYQYVLMGVGAAIFAVNQGGYVYLNTPRLDADPPNPIAYQLTIQAREVGTNPIRSSELLTLTINVVDLNDNAPTFGSQSLEAVAMAGIGQQNIIEIKATDADRGKNGEIFYRIVSVTNHGEPLFRYNKDTGYVVAIAPLPDQEHYQILLEATDGGGRSTQAVILVDVEKYEEPFGGFSTPSFGFVSQTNTEFPSTVTQSTKSIFFPNPFSSEYNVSISESAPVNSVVLSFANAMPTAIGYAIVRGNEDGRFRIDPNSGNLMTVLPLDREMHSKYRLLVQTLDIVANTTVIVNVDVADENDNTPNILNAQPIVFFVQEGHPNTFVGQIQASDTDVGENGRVTFYLISLNEKFSIGPKDGIIRTTAPLRYSEASKYLLTIVARDNGKIPNEANVQVTVNVLESSSKQPFFPISFYNVTVRENSPLGEIMKVHAEQSDPNGPPITYELRQGDPSLFVVDALTGSVSTLHSLDAELKRFHTLIVGTRQNSLQNLNATATILVTVLDVNDWVPLFRPFSYTATITDAVSPGTPITQVTAEDSDLDPPNNIVRYQLTGFGQAREYFRIDPISGLITVSSNLQHAPKPDLILLVEAKDGGTPALSSTATVAVTVRSVQSTSEPFFAPVVTTLFNQTGKSTETMPNLPVQFNVKAFSASVSEGVSPPYFVQILQVDNKPSNRFLIQCNIVSGNFADAFAVSVNREGNCELSTQTILDREKIDMYTLNISVASMSPISAGANVDFAEAVIFVIDVNDNAPQFQFENEYLGYRMYFGALDINAREFSPIMTVKATDTDAGNNSQIVYSIAQDSPDAKYFQITPGGEIKNVKVFSTILDNPTLFFQFRVEAKDTPVNGLPKSSTADIAVNAITSINRFVMVLEGILPDQTFKYIPLIKKSLHNKTGSCRVLEYESITESSSLAAQEKPGTEIVWYAIDPTTGLICRRNQFSQLFEEDNISRVRGELDAYFKMQTIKEASPVVVSASSSLFSYDKWQAAEIALIVLACIIAVGAIIGILSMCYFWTRYKASRRTIVPLDKMQLYAALPKYNALLLPPSEKEYEIQTLQMALPDEQDSIKVGDADFSIEEGIYSIQPPGRLDPFAHHLHNRQPPPHVYIPPPDYPLNSNNNSNNNTTHRHRYGQSIVNGDKTTIL